MPTQLPQQKQKSKLATIYKNIKSTSKRTPHRRTRQANNLPPWAPTSTRLSSRGFLTLPFSRATPPQPEGHEQSLNKEGPPKSTPTLAEAGAESIVYTTPPPPQPHPPPPAPGGSRSSRTIARPALGRALPSPPAAARGSHYRAAPPRRGGVGEPQGAGGGGSCSSGHRRIHPHLHLRPPSSFSASGLPPLLLSVGIS